MRRWSALITEVYPGIMLQAVEETYKATAEKSRNSTSFCNKFAEEETRLWINRYSICLTSFWRNQWPWSADSIELKSYFSPLTYFPSSPRDGWANEAANQSTYAAEVFSPAPRRWVKNTPSLPLPAVHLLSDAAGPDPERRTSIQGFRAGGASQPSGAQAPPREAAPVDAAATLSKGCRLSWALTCQFCHSALLLWRNSQVVFFLFTTQYKLYIFSVESEFS